MTTYTAIPNTDIDPDSPVTTGLVTLLRDNPIAITEGASGAPAIANAALAGYPFSMADDIVAGGWALIESWAPTAVNSKDFVWDESLYSEIKVIVEGVIPATDNVFLRARIGYGNGSTFFAGSVDYVQRLEGFSNAVYGEDTLHINTYIPLSHNGAAEDTVGSAAGEGFSGVFNSIGWNSVVSRPGYTWMNDHEDHGGLPIVGFAWGHVYDNIADTTVMDAIRLYWSSGNFEVAGTIKVYGLKVA